MRASFILFILVLNTQAWADCTELRKKGMALSMVTKPTLTHLEQVQQVIDGLISYQSTLDQKKILKSSIASDYLKLNNYCLFLGSIENLLKVFIRSYEVMELNEEQKNTIKEKSLILLKKIFQKTQTTKAVLMGYEILFELADMGHFNKQASRLESLQQRYLEFKKEVDQRRKNLLKTLSKEKDRAKFRKQFYEKDLELGREELKLINPFLPKG